MELAEQKKMDITPYLGDLEPNSGYMNEKPWRYFIVWPKAGKVSKLRKHFTFVASWLDTRYEEHETAHWAIAKTYPVGQCPTHIDEILEYNDHNDPVEKISDSCLIMGNKRWRLGIVLSRVDFEFCKGTGISLQEASKRLAAHGYTFEHNLGQFVCVMVNGKEAKYYEQYNIELDTFRIRQTDSFQNPLPDEFGITLEGAVEYILEKEGKKNKNRA